MEQTKFTRFKRIIKKNILALAIVLILCGCLICECNISASNVEDHHNNIEIVTSTENIAKIDTIAIKDSIENELINEVSKYISKQAPKSNKFIPKYLVHAGLTNNIDICFMMAQAQIETCFGTTGAGRESARRSMFGVIQKHYDSYDNAISHYIEILKKYYLVKGRTEQHLLVKYVTGTGGRYAGNPRYEIELTTAYNHIKRTTNIYSLQEEYKTF